MTSERSELAARVARLEDIHDVEVAVQRYVRANDSQDPDLLRSVFAEDAVVDIDVWGQCSGVDDIVALYEANWERAVVYNHHVTNQVVDVDGDTAVATSYAIVRTEDVDGRTTDYGGYYERQFERRDGRWVHTYLGIGTQYRHYVDGPSLRRVEGYDMEVPAPPDNPRHPVPVFPEG